MQPEGQRRRELATEAKMVPLFLLSSRRDINALRADGVKVNAEAFINVRLRLGVCRVAYELF